MLTRKPQTQYIALRLCKSSSSMNRQDAQHITQNKQYADGTQLVHTPCVLLIRIYDIIICVDSPDISGPPHSTNMRRYANVSAPRTTQYTSLAQTSLGPRTHPLCVASSDVSVPPHSIRRQLRFLWAPVLICVASPNHSGPPHSPHSPYYITRYIHIYNSL